MIIKYIVFIFLILKYFIIKNILFSKYLKLNYYSEYI